MTLLRTANLDLVWAVAAVLAAYLAGRIGLPYLRRLLRRRGGSR